MRSAIDFAALFDRSPNPYMLLDRELRYVAANQAYLRVTASRLEDLLGRCLFEVFPNDPQKPDDASTRLLRASLERVVQEGVPDTLALIAYRVPRHTEQGIVVEERFWSATHTPVVDRAGRVEFVLQHTVDVTELQRLKRALADAEGMRGREVPAEQVQAGVLERAQRVQETNLSLDAERRHLRRLFEQAPGFMAFLRGPAHVFEIANGAYYQVVGDREIIGRPVREALPEVAGQGYFELLDEVSRTGRAFVGRGMQVSVRRSSGEPALELSVDFVYQPIVEPDGSVSGIFVQGHDMTAQHRAQEELRRYREQLEELVRERTSALAASEEERRLAQAALHQAQKMEAVGKLTGGVAHDFNNLLQVVGGNLQLLQKDLAGNERAQKRVKTALGSVARGAKLASQLLAFARRQPLDPVVLNLGRLVQGMDELLRRTLGERVQVRTHVEPELWNTFADHNQLENVILNLAINACDAMDGEGTLLVRACNARLEAQAATVDGEVRPGQYVLLSVTDDGCGMAPEVLERACEPFFTTKPEGQGTGLGLSMVYGFVKQSGGHVEIDSAVGLGTTIRIYLPRALQAELPPPPEPVPAVVEGGSETILVVEDDAEVRATAVELLSELGYRVLKASDGQGALAVLESGVPVDLLFTDVVMPGPLRSPELAERARALVPDLEVLFTSGYTEDVIVRDGRLLPGVSLLGKPYGREDLARKVRHALRGREQRLQARAASALPPEPAPSAVQPPAQEEGGPLRILFVEDDLEIQEAGAELLEAMGYRVQATGSPEQAAAALDERPFDVLLTDVTLPGMSGLELARRALRQRPQLQVIVASGHGTAALQEAGPELASAVVLPKPYDAKALARALQQASAPRPVEPQLLRAGRG